LRSGTICPPFCVFRLVKTKRQRDEAGKHTGVDLGRPTDAHHARHRRAKQVDVEDADRLLLLRQRHGQVDGRGRLAHASFARRDGHDLFDARDGQPSWQARERRSPWLLLLLLLLLRVLVRWLWQAERVCVHAATGNAAAEHVAPRCHHSQRQPMKNERRGAMWPVVAFLVFPGLFRSVPQGERD